DARIDQGVGDVTDQFHDQPQQGEDEQRAEHHRIVAVDRRFETHQAQAVEGEDHLDEQGAGEEDADEGGGETGNDQQHGVAEYVAVEHAMVGQALGPGGDHVLLVDLVEEAVLGQQGQGGEVAYDQSGDRQHQVPEVVENLAAEAEFFEVVRGQPAQREPVPVAATGEQHDQQNGEEKGRDGVTDDDRRTGPDVEGAAVAGGLGDAQWNGHQIHDQGAPETERDRYRHLL